jgi:hypothetical protein
VLGLIRQRLEEERLSRLRGSRQQRAGSREEAEQFGILRALGEGREEIDEPASWLGVTAEERRLD